MLDDRPRHRHDKDEIKNRADEVAAYYLGAGKSEGDARIVWTCPACKKREKLAYWREGNLLRCFVEGCGLSGSADVITFIAYMEGLDQRTDFREILKRAYDILGLEEASRASGRTPEAKKSTPAATLSDRNSVVSPPSANERGEMFELCGRVFSRVMEISKLEERDRKYLRKRGLSHDTIVAGRFGSMSHDRATYLKRVIEDEFGRDALLRTPGFFEDDRTGRLGFTLTGEYLLIPYLDREGRIANIEGRRVGEVPGGTGRYVALRNSGNHLYVFPAYASEPERIEAFTEGCFGAIVAAQSGVAVGSIQGCKRFKATSSSASPFAKLSEEDDSLHELAGVNFRGRSIPYIPDADDPPNKDVLQAAPKAAECLISRHGGNATLCSLPRGLDLDEWLLSVPAEERSRAFSNLLAKATPLEQAEEWKQSRLRPKTPRKQRKRKHGGESRTQTPEAKGLDETEPGDAGTKLAEGGGDVAADASSEDGRAGRPVGNEGAPEPESETGGSSTEPESGGGEAHTERGLRHEIYSAMLEMAPLKDSHKTALAKLGVLERAMEAGMLGSLDSDSAERVSSNLERRFGFQTLLSVPGFECSEHGRIRIALPRQSDHVLLPCLDKDAFIVAIEAIACDSERAEIPDPGRTTLLAEDGAHLFVFAPYSPGEVEGFCEEPIAAIVAAQYDVVLGAVGYRLHRSEAGETSDGPERKAVALPEIEGVDFGDREMRYVPKPVPDKDAARSRALSAAARRLIKRRNGKTKFLSCPDVAERQPAAGSPAAKTGASQESPGGGRRSSSLLDFILSVPEEERHRRLREMFAESPDRTRSGQGGGVGEDAPSLLKPPSAAELSFATAGAFVAGIGIHTVLGWLEAFGDYVGVGYGGLPFMEGGWLGALRRLAGAAPMEVLNESRMLASMLGALLMAVAAFALHRVAAARRGRRRTLSSYGEGEWRAHLVEEARPSKAVVLPREAVAAAAVGVAVYFILALLGTWLPNLHELMNAAGIGTWALAAVVVESGRLAVCGAAVFGSAVLWRRVSARWQRARIFEGRI